MRLGQLLRLGMQLGKAGGLGPEPVLELGLGVHLHLQQHDRLLRSTALVAARPEHAIEAVISGLECPSLKAVELIPRRISPQAGRGCTTRQQQRDQIRRALKQAVKPVIGFHCSDLGLLRSEGHQDTTTTHQIQLRSTSVPANYPAGLRSARQRRPSAA